MFSSLALQLRCQVPRNTRTWLFLVLGVGLLALFLTIWRAPNPPLRHCFPSEHLKQHVNQSDDSTIRIAFLYLIHNEWAAEGVARSLERLFSPKHTFVIHVDTDFRMPLEKIQNIALNGFAPEARCWVLKNNIFFISKHRVVWGGISIIQAELDLMQVAIDSARAWDYAIILSGQCFPLTTLEGLENTIRILRGPKELRANFNWRSYDTHGINGQTRELPRPNRLLKEAGLLKVEAAQLKNHTFESLFASTKMIWTNLLDTNGYGGISVLQKSERLERKVCIEGEGDSVMCAQELYGIRRKDRRYRQILPNLRFGSQWVFLARPFCEWLLSSSTARNLLVFAANMYIPDESLFQTLAYMTPWRDHSVWYPAEFPMPVRAERWAGECQGPCSLNSTMLEAFMEQGDIQSLELALPPHFVKFVPKTFCRKYWGDEDQSEWVEKRFGPQPQNLGAGLNLNCN